MALEQFRAVLGVDASYVHLNNAGIGPLSLPAKRAIAEASDLMATKAFHGVEEMISAYEKARAIFGSLVGSHPDCVAMTQTCAAAISMVAYGLDLHSGDEILRWDQEYPSNAYPWHSAAQRVGAQVRVVQSEDDYELNTERMLDAFTDKTRVVTVSWVQYQTGAMTDLKALSAECRRRGAWLVVDAIQGLGVVPFDMRSMGVDALCGGTHKWLCGPFGHGFLALAPERVTELEPVLQGALTYGSPDDLVDLNRVPRKDARRFEPGSPVLLGALGGAASIAALLEIGIESIQREAVGLSRRLIQGVEALGMRVIGDRDRTTGSPIVNFVPHGDVREVEEALRKARISVGQRAGGIRVAPHGFNSDEDIDKVLEVLQRL